MGIVMDIEDVGKVIMFGSCSRGTHTDNSDIDLLLLRDSEKSGMPFNRCALWCQQAGEKYLKYILVNKLGITEPDVVSDHSLKRILDRIRIVGTC